MAGNTANKSFISIFCIIDRGKYFKIIKLSTPRTSRRKKWRKTLRRKFLFKFLCFGLNKIFQNSKTAYSKDRWWQFAIFCWKLRRMVTTTTHKCSAISSRYKIYPCATSNVSQKHNKSIVAPIATRRKMGKLFIVGK